MLVHKILSGNDAGRYLPFALNQLRKLQQVYAMCGLEVWQRKWTFYGYTILIKYTPTYAVISITASGSAYFEFQTTGYPVYYDPTTNLPWAATIGVTATTSGIKATLLGGQRFQSTYNTTPASDPLNRAQQAQIFNEPSHEPGPQAAGVYPRTLFESWAPGSSHTGVHMADYWVGTPPWTTNTNVTALIPNSTRDVYYDVGWADASDLNPVRYAYLTPAGSSADWPRAAGIQTVVDPTWGTVEFAVYIDAFDQVSVFPTSQITALTVDMYGNPIQNVGPSYVQTARVTFPSGVANKSEPFSTYYAAHAPDTGVVGGTSQFPEYNWKVSQDGTKACAVVYWQVAATFDTAWYANWATDTGNYGPMTFFPAAGQATDPTTFNRVVDGVLPQLSDLGPSELSSQTVFNQTAPGLLELGIEITLTGPNPEDFTFNLTTNTVRDPNTQGYCTLYAGYVWSDIANIANKNDLCVLDVECYGRNSDGAVATLMSLKNLTQDTEILTFGLEDQGSAVAALSGAYHSPARILAVDMETLSFAIQHVQGYTTNVTDPHTGGYDINGQEHFGIGIYVLGQFQTVLWPQTIDPGAQADILNCMTIDARASINAYTGMTFMPINNLPGWGDPDMASLRYFYQRVDPSLPGWEAALALVNNGGVYTPSYLNPYYTQMGVKFYDDIGIGYPGSPSPSSYPAGTLPPLPTTDAHNWWYYCLARRAPAAPLFDISNPYVGWYQYMGEVIARNMVSPYTTFWAHPNGSWAFFNQEFIYNSQGYGYATDSNDDNWTCTVPLGGINFEHCIFDQIVVKTTKVSLTTSFFDCWNTAVTAAINDSTLTDSSAVIPDYDTLRATFSYPTPIPDGNNSYNHVTYQGLGITWQQNYAGTYQAMMLDRAYFNGTKPRTGDGTLDAPTWDFQPMGIMQNVSLAAKWTDFTYSTYTTPLVDCQPVTFSSVVMTDA